MLIALICFLYLFKYGVRAQSSPCPEYFKYRYAGTKIQGLINLPAFSGLNDLQIEIVFLGNYDLNSVLSVDLEDDDKTAREKFQNGGNVYYRIDFPPNLEHTPKILSIVLNDKKYCDNPNALMMDAELLTVTKVNFKVDAGGSPRQTTPPPKVPNTDLKLDSSPLPIIPSLTFPTIQNENKEKSSDRGWLQELPYSEECGVHFTPIQTIINGRELVPNELPWLVALFDKNRKYFCGGSLVSNKHVITAAHCCIEKDWIFLELGKHLLTDEKEAGSILRLSQRIVTHPDYRMNTGHADIALIVLNERVHFSDKIKPICLWPFPSHKTGANGTVAGWGNDISGTTTDTPMAADVSIVSDEECLSSNKLFSTLTSDTTFCAGGKNKGPCSGDSGAGFILNEDSRWYLKGIISVSLSSNPSAGVCDVNKFAVYCDVGKYLGWLKEYII